MQPGDQQRVGGRPGDPHPQPGGGGYQNICTESEFAVGRKKNRADPRVIDPRYLALVEMGMTERCLAIARGIGMDNFLFLWEVLDETRPGSCVRLTMPRFTRYLRFMRNRIVLNLAHMGAPVHVIQRRLKVELNEELSERHVRRIREKFGLEDRSDPTGQQTGDKISP